MNTLRRGMRGRDVRDLKTRLKKLNLKMTDSQTFDLQTEAGVRTLQEHVGLEKDGIVGPKTWGELLDAQAFPEVIDPIQWIKITPYYPQRDNEYHPGGTCNVTSLAMVLAYHGQVPSKADQLEDELFLRLQQPDAKAEFARSYPSLVKMGYKPRHIHGMLRWLAKKYGYDARYSEKASLQDMAAWGSKVGPMVISGRFTAAGHIVTLVGMTQGNDLICHDPWGDWNSGYKSRDGKYRIYNREAMLDVLKGHSHDLKRCHFVRP